MKVYLLEVVDCESSWTEAVYISIDLARRDKKQLEENNNKNFYSYNIYEVEVIDK